METPRSKAGLLGRNAIDMRVRPWGKLRAVRQSMQRGFWYFECSAGCSFQLEGGKVRKDDAKGIEAECPVCKSERKGQR